MVYDTVDIPTLVTYWWREHGSPADVDTYNADIRRAATTIKMARAGSADRQRDIVRAWRDVAKWSRDPASKDRLPLGVTHPTRPA